MNERESNDKGTVFIKGKQYPHWAVEEAKTIIKQYGEDLDLECTVQSVLDFDEAEQAAETVDPNSSGKGSSHFIGGYVVSKTKG